MEGGREHLLGVIVRRAKVDSKKLVIKIRFRSENLKPRILEEVY